LVFQGNGIVVLPDDRAQALNHVDIHITCMYITDTVHSVGIKKLSNAICI